MSKAISLFQKMQHYRKLKKVLNILDNNHTGSVKNPDELADSLVALGLVKPEATDEVLRRLSDLQSLGEENALKAVVELFQGTEFDQNHVIEVVEDAADTARDMASMVDIDLGHLLGSPQQTQKAQPALLLSHVGLAEGY
jgi:Ca2+-binding EF-hand superfamily protein